MLQGGGNNGEDGTEGAVYRDAYGCYLHGSLLPKNPWFADRLLAARCGGGTASEIALAPSTTAWKGGATPPSSPASAGGGRVHSGAW